MDAALPRYRAVIGSVSLVAGPALMSVGDLLHPAETWDPAAQVALVAAAPTRWYAAHLLLFIGLLLFVPAILLLTRAAASRKPAAGYFARLLLLVSVGALSAVFAFEMLLGRRLSGGADPATATALLETFQSAEVFAVLMPALLAFFVGTGLAVWALASSRGPWRPPALVLALGAVLILAEIILAEVRLSQVGNLLIFAAGVMFARRQVHGQPA